MLQGKIALITGADTVVGSAIAKRFAFENASLILTSESLPALKNLDNEIDKLGKGATLVQLDVLDLEQISALVSSVENMFGRLDIMVSSHFCVGKPNLLIDCSPQLMKQIVDFNFCANWYLVKHFNNLCNLSDCPRIIFTAIESFIGKSISSFAPYMASQAGLIKLLECYTQEIKHTQIKANMIAIEEYDESLNFELSSDFTDAFVHLALNRSCITGKKYYLQYK